MKSSQIKTECELIYTQRKSLLDRLARLQSICKHPNTFEGNYSYRVGSIVPATICSDCSKVLRTEWDSITSVTSTTWEKLANINREEI